VSVGVGHHCAALGPDDEILLQMTNTPRCSNPVQALGKPAARTYACATPDLAEPVRPAPRSSPSADPVAVWRAAPARRHSACAKAVGARTLIDATHACRSSGSPTICRASTISPVPRTAPALPARGRISDVAPELWDAVPPVLATGAARRSIQHLLRGDLASRQRGAL